MIVCSRELTTDGHIAAQFDGDRRAYQSVQERIERQQCIVLGDFSLLAAAEAPVRGRRRRSATRHSRERLSS